MTKKTTTTTTARATAEELYNQAEKAVYIALRARHEKSGLKFLEELQNSQTADRKARNNISIAEELAKHEKTLAELRTEYTALLKLKATADRQAVNIKLPQELRQAWAERSREITATVKHYKNNIDREQTTANNLFNQLETTYTDRADLTQTAVLKILELEREPAEIRPNVLAVYGVESADELTDTERADAQQQANFRVVINAVGKCINTLATPEALNRTTTKAEQITAEQVEEFINIYGGIGNDYKAPQQIKRCRLSDCYVTVEERHTAKQNGFYKVTHYKTIAPYQYIEDFRTTEDGENDIGYIKSYNPFVNTSADLDRIEELYNKANLTDRQKQWLNAFMSYCRFSADFKECKEHAFKVVGITTATNKTTFFNRLKKALATANK